MEARRDWLSTDCSVGRSPKIEFKIEADDVGAMALSCVVGLSSLFMPAGTALHFRAQYPPHTTRKPVNLLAKCRSDGINTCMTGAGCVACICEAGKTFSSG
jgi:hypothetical protein